MSEMQVANRWGAVGAFLSRFAPGARVSLLENPTEELDHELSRGKQPRLFSMAGNRDTRIEENYLYYTRRFPDNVVNNTIGSGAVVAGDYPYFSTGQGDVGTVAGYFSIPRLGLQQTNMAAGGRMPTGRAMRLYDLGVTFNAQAVAADIAQILDVANLRYEKQNRALVLEHGPLGLWPGGTGLYGFAATTATTTTLQSASNGMPSLANARRFRSPREINQNESFNYIVAISNANLPNVNAAVALSAFVEVRIWLFGHQYDKNPV